MTRHNSRRRSNHANEEAVIEETVQLKRSIPTYEMLSEESLQIIEAHADRIGAEIGIEFRDDETVLALWRDAGAIVEGELVKFPPGFLRAIIQKTTPAQFTHHARNPKRSVEVGGDNIVFCPNYGSPFVSDIEKGRRYASYEDFVNIVKLVYMSPWLNLSGGTVCEPTDIAVNKRHLDMLYAHMKYSDKPFMGGVTSGARAQDCVNLCQILFGEAFVDNNCVMASIINVNSPLVFDDTMLAALKIYAANNQACIITPFILTGAMGPVTIEAAIAQALVEAMSGIALTQLIRPGCPVILGTFTSSMSLKSGAPTFGMPEPTLAYFAMGQLARRLGVPLRGGGSLTASKAADYQAGQESSDTLMTSILSGINYIMHSAGWQEGGLVFGMEKFMLDDDHVGMMYKMSKGLVLDDNNLAMDAYQEIGPGNHYLGCAHTMRNYKTALHNPELSDSESYEQWIENGSLTSEQRAHVKFKARLRDYKGPELDADIDARLLKYIADKKASMPDALE